jgi:nucleoside-diphosphate-sugar epimerase
MSYYTGRRVLVTGGASFIGSHLVEALVAEGARVRIVDDLSSGKLENLSGVNGDIEFRHEDLRFDYVADNAVQEIDVVFHLAAAHGGRGYVDTHQAECANNFLLDAQVINAAKKWGVYKLVFASSACIYPTSRLQNPAKTLHITEDMAGPPFEPDGAYGWAKMAGEITLRAYAKAGWKRAAVCRFFHTYGPRMVENHALAAFMARAYTKQDPFIVWGDGTQVRDWIHVSDIVSGLLLAGEKVSDGTPINLGTGVGVSVAEAAGVICEINHFAPKLEFEPDKPTGPLNRVADISRAHELLGWVPKVKFADGIRETVNWYNATHDTGEATAALETKLMGR